MKLTGNIVNCNVDFLKSKAYVMFEVNELTDAAKLMEVLDKVLTINVNLYKKKRSIDANAYFWTLCGKLADKTRQNKTDIYKHLIKEIGNNYEIVPIKNEAVQSWVEAWEHNGLGWICETLGNSKFAGYTNICCYYGSSTYNTKQMSALIDSIIFECKEQDIQTLTPDEVAKLKAMWGEDEKHN